MKSLHYDFWDNIHGSVIGISFFDKDTGLDTSKPEEGGKKTMKRRGFIGCQWSTTFNYLKILEL